MKKIINIMFIAVLSAISLMSCDKGLDNIAESEGKFSFQGFEATVQNGETVIESRASSVDVNSFKVIIVNKSTNTNVGSWVYSSLPEIVTLPVGSYKVEVYNSELKNADWESPYFYGSQDFIIKENDVTTVDPIVCKLSNLKVTIKYSDELKSAVGQGEDVKVNVAVGENNSLDFTYGETRSGYFRCDADSKTLVATFSGTVEGFYISEYKIFSDVAAGQHRIITFSLKSAPDVSDEYGSVGTTGLKLNASVTTVDMTKDVPAEEEIIKPDDYITVSESTLSYTMKSASKDVAISASDAWTAVSSETWCTVSPATGNAGESKLTISVADNTVVSERTATVTVSMGTISQEITVRQAAFSNQPTAAAPTITSASEGIVLNQACVVTASTNVAVDIQAEGGVDKLEVNIISDVLSADELASMGLPAQFDLASPGDLEATLGGPDGFGFPVGAQVKNNKDVINFNVTKFMGLLCLLGEATHTFRLTVTDNLGQSTSADLILKVE